MSALDVGYATASAAFIFCLLAPGAERRVVLTALGVVGAIFGAAASLSWASVAEWVL